MSLESSSRLSPCNFKFKHRRGAQRLKEGRFVTDLRVQNSGYQYFVSTMASTVLAQRGATSLLGASSHIAQETRPCRASAALPLFPCRRNTLLRLPLRTPSSQLAAHIEQARRSQRMLPAAARRSVGVRAESPAGGEVLQNFRQTPEGVSEPSAPVVQKLAETVVGAAVALGQTMKQQWWGENGAAAKRMAVAFAFAALPIVLSGFVGVPSALAAAGGRYQRNQTSRGIMYFAMTLLVSVKQVRNPLLWCTKSLYHFELCAANLSCFRLYCVFLE